MRRRRRRRRLRLMEQQPSRAPSPHGPTRATKSSSPCASAISACASQARSSRRASPSSTTSSAARGLPLRPPCYLGDEWFTPSEQPIIAIPFYLAHPRLKALELRQMMEVEGGTPECVRAAPAARVRARGRSRLPLLAAPSLAAALRQPRQRRDPRHLSAAPVHEELRAPPAELVRAGAPRRGLRRDVRRVARRARARVARQVPRVEGAGEARVRRRADARGGPAARAVRRGCRRGASPTPRACARRSARYYAERRKLYAEDYPDFYDADLRAIFGGEPSDETAAPFMRKARKAIVPSIVRWTGQRKYTVDRLVRRLMMRCQRLGADGAAERRAWRSTWRRTSRRW